ncbi:hypothetical protein AKJ09_01288 [Labilithrix luteola]|uniref:Uncharacterized protein n=1 Tax=Labilithrix luteola TaxID=1391654 RepID=A0A0K1PND8_9BACT|nr:hypothetical protein [Labilithrix luteola]AKU94624.1 hypothetical protein AKJ09_01288 [Labilithrix luteola]
MTFACGKPMPKTPVDACTAKCEEMASRQCSPAECARGCEFILDRLVEGESKNVLACVARTDRRCGDVLWAHCATHIGPHADGGPPGPPPPADDE